MDPNMSSYLRTWYAAQSDTPQAVDYAFPIVQQAFRDGLVRFASHLTSDTDKINLSRGSANIQDVQTLAHNSLTKYSDEQRFSNAKKWLHRIVSRVHHYSNIMDVLAQHHPEYVALAWGAMKLVLMAAHNHETTVCLISKALSQIADTLPRVELATVLYPTERMRRAVGNLYANLIRFFIRAHQWCSEGTWKHLLHSITRPVELRYKDLLEDIAADSREIDQLATAGTRVEVREMSLKLTDIAAKLESMQALQSSSFIDTNQRLSDLQFSQIISYMAESKLGDPLEAFRFNQSLQRQQQYSQVSASTNRFWQSPKLQAWSSVSESRVAVVKGGFSARYAMRGFCLNMIQQLQSKNVPVLWALRRPRGQTDAGDISPIDLFKHLIQQALRLNGSMTEKGMSLQCGRFQRATTEQEWLRLLGSALLQAHSQVYLVIDLSILNCNLLPTEGFSWLAAFQSMLTEIAKQAPNLQVKVLLLGSMVNFITICFNVSNPQQTTTMVHISFATLGLMALASTTTASAIKPSSNDTVVFSWEAWANGIMANPCGTHATPEEAVELSRDTTSSVRLAQTIQRLQDPD
ncbi:hypothetical protein FALBO_1495 [Fusarium albosuccineum]|uniref:DUF7708 domain-containing protein n=1 Tax=Fusarium albosuccineum TaxID=1237068 RepID=A0A8H4LMT1_9HYPO|nr:hypothetical protein FALBO_1495 [Fusarium albosuccineum]